MQTDSQPNPDNSQASGVHEHPTAIDTKPKSRKKLILTISAVVLVIASAAVAWVVLSAPATKTGESSVSQSASKPIASAISIPDSINPVDPEKLPVGENRYTSTGPKAGYVYSCQAQFGADAGGAQVAGPWINQSTKTWNSKQKVTVSGNVLWPNASYQVSSSSATRNITANGLPINNQPSGTFPIQSNDTAFQYDRNPNSIAAKTIAWQLPVTPVALGTPQCTNMGAIGILNNGVVLFNALDGMGRDAAAYETLDKCEGHPERTSEYHHHTISSCILSKYTTPNTSTLVGYAIDGYGIYVEIDKNGKYLTNENLDECHGRTSNILWDGKVQNMYHYVATIEYPYTIGCFRAKPAVETTSQQQSSTTQQQRPQGPPPPR